MENKTVNVWFWNRHLLKLSFVILIISINVYYVFYNDYDYETIPLWGLNKTYEFLIETGSTLMLSANIIYKKFLYSPKINVILNNLLEEEAKYFVHKSSKIAIGLGACTDLLVEAIDLFKNVQPPKVSHPHDHIEDWTNFLEVFAYYFQQGTASE